MPRPRPPAPIRLRWILLTALLLGIGAGLLAVVGDVNVPTAILTGAGTFSGSVLLLLEMIAFARPPKNR
ncbi:hypothetical protein [Actinoplanes sp. N902-109]|uniref:hypothetical protein n=1 Tax=Actinoplanes sp. (strain N902-109) TaxID=649831 RepID=UPI000329525E|nr:hypothetical protein [Actinoplanes sp. N902-109]AGL18774.1 hypothetical protein L083_5264 [Actinoplanes sp. N902-109]